jgi:hypothetical protein
MVWQMMMMMSMVRISGGERPTSHRAADSQIPRGGNYKMMKNKCLCLNGNYTDMFGFAVFHVWVLPC